MTENAGFGTDDLIFDREPEIAEAVVHGRFQFEFPVSVQRDFLHNLIPVTIGNVIGGAGLVGIVYWFAYQRRKA